jgi:phage shock protein PspC (stress-responsive transcriptional regulator)
MNKTMNINIAGRVFQIDDDAFEKLREYLQAVNFRFRQIPGGHEALDDFEARVAEIFLTKKGITGIITSEDIEEMIAIMGRPEDIDDGYDDEVKAEPAGTKQRRLYRNPNETVISGVAGGLGAYLNVDPVWIRLLFILTTVFYGFGFFVYIALWVALPSANSEGRMRELYGSNMPGKDFNVRSRQRGSDAADRVGGALNEIFRAIGNFFIILFRAILIIIGIFFIIMGVSLLVVVVITLFFNHGAWLPDSLVSESFFLADFFSLVLTPSAVPWVIGLSLAAMALPLLALIYWGIKMIFQFRARDGVISIAGLILWVLTCVSLTMILFHEGISFAENGRSIVREELTLSADSLWLIPGREASSIGFDREVKLPFDDHLTFYTTPSGRIFCQPNIRITGTDEPTPYLEIRKHGNGPTKRVAIEKAESLEFDFSLSGDSILLDSFFALPENSRWNGAMIDVVLFLPEGTKIFIDKRMGEMLHRYYILGVYREDLAGKWWTMTENDEGKLILK